MKRLSIIIPCYQADHYIKRCLDSVLNIKLPQQDYEIICFDDACTDETPFILDDYAQRYSNIRVIHSAANVGPGGAQ